MQLSQFCKWPRRLRRLRRFRRLRHLVQGPLGNNETVAWLWLSMRWEFAPHAAPTQANQNVANPSQPNHSTPNQAKPKLNPNLTNLKQPTPTEKPASSNAQELECYVSLGSRCTSTRSLGSKCVGGQQLGPRCLVGMAPKAAMKKAGTKKSKKQSSIVKSRAECSPEPCPDSQIVIFTFAAGCSSSSKTAAKTASTRSCFS